MVQTVSEGDWLYRADPLVRLHVGTRPSDEGARIEVLSE
jgi:hypothetical protein